MYLRARQTQASLLLRFATSYRRHMRNRERQGGRRAFVQAPHGTARLFSSTLHCSLVTLIVLWSHARALRHSRCTVGADTPSASAVSSMFKPPKNRSSTILLFRGSTADSLVNASS